VTASIGLADLTETATDRLLDKVSIPKLQKPVLPLPSVYNMMSEGTTGPLTVVRGPADAGKTVLVAAWIANDLPSGLVAWLSLDEHDNEPVAFWTLTLEALRRHGVALPADVRSPSEPGSHILTFLEELSAALHSHSDPVVLVLDHFDAVTDRHVMRQLGFLLRHSMPQLRLLVTTRRSPSGVLAGPRLTLDL
jgi:LuxR family maltose regulon positive regulatory protein